MSRGWEVATVVCWVVATLCFLGAGLLVLFPFPQNKRTVEHERPGDLPPRVPRGLLPPRRGLEGARGYRKPHPAYMDTPLKLLLLILAVALVGCSKSPTAAVPNCPAPYVMTREACRAYADSVAAAGVH